MIILLNGVQGKAWAEIRKIMEDITGEEYCPSSLHSDER